MARMERKDIEEEDRKFVGKSEYGGRSNWDTYETALILDSDESSYKRYEYFNDSGDIIDDDEFDMHGGDFSTVFSKDGYTYNVSGTVYKEKVKWKAEAETEKVDF